MFEDYYCEFIGEAPDYLGFDLATEINNFSKEDKKEFFDSFMKNLDEESQKIIESYVDFVV